MQAGIVENYVCSFIVKIGIKTLPAFSILVGEATMSSCSATWSSCRRLSA
ncbi:MAG TPA: hypothetical protein VLA68_03450 [Nitrososphaera sp.]|nr:hypothetical protein [Nitrososphaera sp.]